MITTLMMDLVVNLIVLVLLPDGIVQEETLLLQMFVILLVEMEL